MPTEPETPAVDWRAEAEARGRAAFEAATADPQPAPTALVGIIPKKKEFTRCKINVITRKKLRR